MRIIAKKGNSRFLVQSENDVTKSRVWDDKEKQWQGEEFNTQSILMRGYWDEIFGSFDPVSQTIVVYEE